MEQERIVYLNGKMVPDSQALVSIEDRGFLLGDGCFDTTRTFNHKIFKLSEHLDRWFDSLQYLRIDIGMDKAKVADLTMQVLEANLPMIGKEDDLWVTQKATRGLRGVTEKPKPTVIIETRAIPFKSRGHYYSEGIPLIVASVRRTPPESLSPRVKSHNYLNLIMADLEVKSRDPNAWAITLDVNGNLAEGDGSNIFVVKNGAVFTPRTNFVLGGISRQTTIELAHEIGIEMVEKDIDLFDAYTADEMFVTATSICICPVSSINGAKIASGKVPGPITSRLLEAYSGLVGKDIVRQFTREL